MSGQISLDQLIVVMEDLMVVRVCALNNHSNNILSTGTVRCRHVLHDRQFMSYSHHFLNDSRNNCIARESLFISGSSSYPPNLKQVYDYFLTLSDEVGSLLESAFHTCTKLLFLNIRCISSGNLAIRYRSSSSSSTPTRSTPRTSLRTPSSSTRATMVTSARSSPTSSSLAPPTPRRAPRG